MISVIIPLYNKAASIEQTLRSVLSQDYDDFEVVVVDDGSTDNSAQIVKKYENKLCLYDNLQVSTNGSNDNNASQTITTPNTQHPTLITHHSSPNTYHSSRSILLIEQENGGPSKARNTGVKHAQGEWIVFLDADDELMPGALRRFAEVAKNNPNIHFFNSSFYIDNGTERRLMGAFKEGIVGNNYREHALGHLIPRAGTMLVSRQIMQEFPFNNLLRRFEDLEHLLRIYKFKVYSIKQPSMVVNAQYAEASKGRKNIDEDFMGHLSLSGKGFWEQMCVFKLFLEQREIYLEDCKRLYPLFFKRYDLYCAFQIISKVVNFYD